MNAAPLKPRPTFRQSLASAEVPADDLERRRELGQFLTPPDVAGFIWDLLEVIQGKRFQASTRLIDPACGEGVFLRVAHERGGLPARSLFGADIDETLAPGWRQDPLLRDANIGVANGLLDDPASGIVTGAFDVIAGNPPFSGKGLRDLLRLLEESPAGTRHEEQDLFGAACLKEEAAPSREPLSRQERAELDRLVRTLSQYSCWRLETEPEPDDEADEASEGAPNDLFAPAALRDKRRPTASDYERASQLIAQWPQNRLLDTAQPDVRDTIRRLASTSIEVMFTERFVRLAKPGGLIAIIVPESIVASDRIGPFRIWLMGRMDLLATVGLPQKVFKGVGANAKTTIVYARRRTKDRPDGWYSSGAYKNMPEENVPIFLTAPLLDFPSFSIESYLARVLADAQRQRETFWPDPK
jgi:N-6 DNA Methylase